MTIFGFHVGPHIPNIGDFQVYGVYESAEYTSFPAKVCTQYDLFPKQLGCKGHLLFL